VKKLQSTHRSLSLKTLRSIRKKMTNVKEKAAEAADASHTQNVAAPSAGEGDATARPKGSGRKLRTPFRRRRGDAAQPQAGQEASEGTPAATEGGAAEQAGPASKRSSAPRARKTSARGRKTAAVTNSGPAAAAEGAPAQAGADAAANPAKGRRR